jgi:hypothetical protein
VVQQDLAQEGSTSRRHREPGDSDQRENPHRSQADEWHRVDEGERRPEDDSQREIQQDHRYEDRGYQSRDTEKGIYGEQAADHHRNGDPQGHDGPRSDR